MTYDEWQDINLLLKNAWTAPLDWSQERSDTYFALLADHDAQAVLAGVHHLLNQGSEYRPSAAQIIAAINQLSDAHLPPWNVVWQSLQYALRMSHQDRAIQWLENNVHPLVARFLETEGWQTLRRVEFYGDYGSMEIERLRRRYEDFARRAGERVLYGRTLFSLTGDTSQPRRLDALGALGLNRKELTSGE